MASTFITRTPSSNGSETKATLSMWFKRSGLSAQETLYFSSSNSDNKMIIRFNSDDTFDVRNKVGGSFPLDIETNRKFRDTGAWMHFVFKFDTTQATSSDRFKMYVNGTDEKGAGGYSTETYPSQNANLSMNQTDDQLWVCSESGTGSTFDGLVAHVHWTDGYAYDASTFGETDSTSGIWVPKSNPSVTYGTNGFFLKFENSGNMDLDSSGNNLSFTTSGNLTQNIDSPTNNFATLNPLVYTTMSGTVDFGNRNFTKSSSVNRSCFSTLAASSGKWYCEVKVLNNSNCKLGIADISANYNFNGQTLDFSDSTYGYSYNQDGNKSVAGNSSSYGTSYSNNDIIGIAMDLDNSKLYFSKNGTFQNSGVPTSGSTGTGAISINAGGDYAFAGKVNGGTDLGFNFGSGDYAVSSTVASSNADDNNIGSFEYDVPAGYYSLCTKNIKEFG